MIVALWTVALAGGLPGAEIRWKGPDGVLSVTPPPGEHVAAEASVRVDLAWAERALSLVIDGADLPRGVPLPGIRGTRVAGAIDLSLCEDGGSACRRVSLEVAGSVGGARKGRVALDVTVPEASEEAPPSPESPYRRDATADVEAALAEAAASGRTVLLDFSAVWCPPCNLLAAEVFHAPDVEETLSDVIVVVIDVDDPRSWALKDRYHVGGYPTVVAVDGTGAEIDRLLGYDGREAVLRWIADVADGEVAPIVPDAAPEEVPPEEAARIALALLERGDDGYAPWLARAEAAPDAPDTRVARFVASPTVEDLAWLIERAPDRADAIVLHALPLAKEAPDRVRRLAHLALGGADPVRGADVLYVAAEASPPDDAPLLYTAAARLLAAASSGDPRRDRAHATFLSSLMAAGGDVDGAVALLDRYAAVFPEDPTWPLAASARLLDAGRPEAALAKADEAIARAWGDNALRAAKARADALVALGRTDEARAYAMAVLAETPAPPAGLDVRTFRYRAALEALAAGEAE